MTAECCLAAGNAYSHLPHPVVQFVTLKRILDKREQQLLQIGRQGAVSFLELPEGSVEFVGKAYFAYHSVSINLMASLTDIEGAA